MNPIFRYRLALSSVLTAILVPIPAVLTAEEPSVVPVASQAGARIWLGNASETLRRGERLDIRFSVPDDAYVAVVHIDADGALDFLFPSSPWRSEYVRGGRAHSLPTLGSSSRYVRSSDGIGYLYLIASPYPLDFSYFRGPAGTGWYWGYAGRAVHGDPFLAFDQITRLIVPAWPSAFYFSDYFGYYVGGFRNYPVYACSDRYYDSGWGWTTSYGPCARQDYFLRQYPNYYDTRRYAGDRRVVLRQYEHLEPAHRFKESPTAGWTTVPGRVAVPAGRDALPDGSAGRTPLSDTGGRPAQSVPVRDQPGRFDTPATGQRERPAPTPTGAASGAGRGSTAVPAAQPPSRNPAARGAAGTPTPSRAGGSGAGSAPSTTGNAGRGAAAPASTPASSRRP